MYLWKRIRLFSSIVWRPVTGPVAGEVWPLSKHLYCLMSVSTAWRVASIIHPSPAQERRSRAKFRASMERMRARVNDSVVESEPEPELRHEVNA